MSFENNFTSQSIEKPKITRENLMAFAKEKPAGDMEVREMLIGWLQETSIPEGSPVEVWEYADVAIMHAAMKYRLGFLDVGEVIEELGEIRSGLVAAKDSESKDLLSRIEKLMYAIEENTFDFN